MSSIRIRLLGSFEVRRDTTALAVPAGRQRALLALLALRNFTLPETIFSVRASAERVPLTDDIPGEEGY